MESPEMAEQEAGQQEWGEEGDSPPKGEAAGRFGQGSGLGLPVPTGWGGLHFLPDPETRIWGGRPSRDRNPDP